MAMENHNALQGNLVAYDKLTNVSYSSDDAAEGDTAVGSSVIFNKDDGSGGQLVVKVGTCPLVFKAADITSIDAQDTEVTITAEDKGYVKITARTPEEVNSFLRVLAAAHICDGGARAAQENAAKAGVGERKRLAAEAEEHIAAGLIQLLGPIVEESDMRVQGVMESQTVLFKELDRLCNALEPFQQAPQPPDFHVYMGKLSKIRTRVSGVQTNMATILSRLRAMQASVDPGGRLHHLAEKGRRAAEATKQEGLGGGLDESGRPLAR